MNTDILVIGGGLHGLSAGLNILRRGLSVVIVEKDFVGKHASGSTAAGVRSLGRDYAELPLSLKAAEMWHNMEEVVGDDCGFTACGQMLTAEDEAAYQALHNNVRKLQSLGYDHEVLIDTQEVREIVPQIIPTCLGAIWVDGDGSADPHKTLRAYKRAFLAEGGKIIEQCSIQSIQRKAGTWTIATNVDLIHTPLIVNAAGAWSGKVAKLAGDNLEHQIRNSMMVVTERVQQTFKPVISSHGRKLSFKQTSQGTLLIGGGAQGKLAKDGESASIDAVALSAAVGAATRLIPAIGGVRIVRIWAGMEAQTPDHIPAIGYSEAVDGLVHVFGFSGHGFQLVPSVGIAIADLVCEGQAKDNLEAFKPSRLSLEKVAA